MKWLMRVLASKYCLHRSPEGMICTRRRFHDGLHTQYNKGDGWAWGPDNRELMY